MVLLVAELPPQLGLLTSLQPFWQPLPQKSDVVPQKPYCEQQTFNGHVFLSAGAYCPHSASASQFDVQFPDPQNDGPKPQNPEFEQQPILQGWLAEQSYCAEANEMKRAAMKAIIEWMAFMLTGDILAENE
jgi:hypothetical protein